MNTIELIYHLRGFHPDIRAVAGNTPAAIAARYSREDLERWHAESPHQCAPALRPAAEPEPVAS